MSLLSTLTLHRDMLVPDGHPSTSIAPSTPRSTPLAVPSPLSTLCFPAQNRFSPTPTSPTMTRPDRVDRFMDPHTIQGDTRVCILVYCGMGSTTYSTEGFIATLVKEFGLHAKIIPILGNKDGKEGLVRTSNKERKQHLQAEVDFLRKEYGGKIVFVGFSTGALVGLNLEGEKPGTFDSMILYGTPIALPDRKEQEKLAAVYRITQSLSVISSFLSLVPFGKHFREWILGQGFARKDCIDLVPHEIRSQYLKDPGLLRFPFKALLDVYELAEKARAYLKSGKISIPMFTAQGELDRFCHPSCSHRILSENRHPDTALRKTSFYSRLPHSSMFHRGFHHDGIKFMKEFLRICCPEIEIPDSQDFRNQNKRALREASARRREERERLREKKEDVHATETPSFAGTFFSLLKTFKTLFTGPLKQ